MRVEIAEFVDYYNLKRYHAVLGDVTPDDMHFWKKGRNIESKKSFKLKTLVNCKRRNKQFVATECVH